jgi:hypothetical protein
LQWKKEIKTGQMKGRIQLITFSDYQEVDGLYFAFSMGQGIKDMGTSPINFTSIELNPEVDDAIFKFPEEEVIRGEERRREIDNLFFELFKLKML